METQREAKKEIRFSKFSLKIPSVRASKLARYLRLRRSNVVVLQVGKGKGGNRKRKAQEIEDEDKLEAWNRKKLRLAEPKPVELKLYDTYQPQITTLPLHPRISRRAQDRPGISKSFSSPAFIRHKCKDYFSNQQLSKQSPLLTSFTKSNLNIAPSTLKQVDSTQTTFRHPKLSSFRGSSLNITNLSKATSSPALSRRPSSLQIYKQTLSRKYSLVAPIPPKIEDILRNQPTKKKKVSDSYVMSKSKSTTIIDSNSPAPVLPPRNPRMKYTRYL